MFQRVRPFVTILILGAASCTGSVEDDSVDSHMQAITECFESQDESCFDSIDVPEDFPGLGDLQQHCVRADEACRSAVDDAALCDGLLEACNDLFREPGDGDDSPQVPDLPERPDVPERPDAPDDSGQTGECERLVVECRSESPGNVEECTESAMSICSPEEVTPCQQRLIDCVLGAQSPEDAAACQAEDGCFDS